MTRRPFRGLGHLATATVLLCVPAQLQAQAGWDVVLTIDPYPSPYYSDWDANPNLGTLTVSNATQQAEQIRIHYNVIDRSNRVVVSGVSEPQSVGADATAIFHSPYTIEGSSTNDSELESLAARTGRLPEGEYTVCASVADASGFVLGESCASFTIVYPDPPLLLEPGDEDNIVQGDPLFVWTPVQVPIDYQLSYVMRIVEVLDGQTPADAIRSNIPHFQVLDAQSTNLRYPLEGQPLVVGKTYAWSVQVLDQNGYAASSNDGRSEIRTFMYDDGTAPKGKAAPITLALLNDSSSTEQPDSLVGIKEICSSWSQPPPKKIVFPVTSRFFPNQTASAFLVRDTVAGMRHWAAFTGSAMLAGDCGPTNGTFTRPKWVAYRVEPGKPFASWLFGDSTQTPDDNVAIKYGVAVLGLFEQDISADGALDVVNDFFDHREIPVKRGINVQVVLDARQLPRLWSVLSNVYDDDEHELSGLGFMGMNAKFAARVGIGQQPGEGVGGGAEVLGTWEYFTLSLKLPEKKLDNEHVQSFQAGLEISLTDSTSKGVGIFTTDKGRDWVIKPMVTVSQDSITWTGALEFDFGQDRNEWLWKAFTSPKIESPKVTLRLKTDHEWQPGPLAGSEVSLGNPEIWLDINSGLLNAVKRGSAGFVDWDLNGRGSVIWQGEDIATFGLTVGRKANDPYAPWEAQVKRSKEQVERSRRLADDLADAKEKALIAGDEKSATNFHNRYQETLQQWHVDREQLSADSIKLEQFQKRMAGGWECPTCTSKYSKPKPNPAAGKTFWNLSLALGNMSIGRLIELIAPAVIGQSGGAQ